MVIYIVAVMKFFKIKLTHFKLKYCILARASMHQTHDKKEKKWIAKMPVSMKLTSIENNGFAFVANSVGT